MTSFVPGEEGVHMAAPEGHGTKEIPEKARIIRQDCVHR